jgi:chromosome partitioning protein
MRVWTFAVQRGGSGKTSLATHLAAYATSPLDKDRPPPTKERIAIIDLDPQHSAYVWHQKRGTDRPNVIEAAPDKLAKMIAAAEDLGVTLVMIDTAGKIDHSTLAAMRLSDLIIVPVTACLFDHVALQDTVKLLEMAGKKHAAIGVINQVPTNRLAQWVDETSVLIERAGLPVADAHVHHLYEQFLEANNAGKGVTEMKGKKFEKAAEDIRKLWTCLARVKVSAPKTKEAVR